MPKYDFNKVAKQSNFIEITLRHGCCPVNLLHIFRTPFIKNTLTGCFSHSFQTLHTKPKKGSLMLPIAVQTISLTSIVGTPSVQKYFM